MCVTDPPLRQSSSTTGDGRMVRNMLIIGLVAFAVTVVVALVVALQHTGVLANDDQALIDLRVFDVGAHTPLVGSYERYGGNQPGPLLFYLLAIPYRLAGPGGRGLAVGSVLLTFASVGGCILIAVRRGGALAGLWATGLLLVVLEARGVDILTSPWEPQVLLCTFALLLFLVWEITAGTVWALPIAAAVATVLAQAWVVYAVLVAVIAVVGAAVGIGNVVSERRTPGTRPGAFGALLLTVAVLGVLWLPPALDQITHDPGNLTDLTSMDRQGSAAGLRDGYRAVAIQFGTEAPWFRGEFARPDFQSTVDLGAGDGVPWALLAFVAAAVVGRTPAIPWRRRAQRGGRCGRPRSDRHLRADLRRNVRVDRGARSHPRNDAVVRSGILDRRRAAPGVTTCRHSGRGTRPRHRGCGDLVALSVDLIREPDDAGRLAEMVARLARDARGQSGLRDPVLVTSTIRDVGQDGNCCAPILASVLTRSGTDVVVPAHQARRYGTHRARTGSARSALLLTSYLTPRPPARPGFVLAGTADPLTRRERAVVEAIHRQLVRLLGPDASLDQVAAARKRSPDVARLLRLQARLPSLPRLALYLRRLAGPVPP